MTAILAAEPAEDEVACPECHGEGFWSCVSGCHTRDCDYCEGTGYVPPDALPA